MVYTYETKKKEPTPEIDFDWKAEIKNDDRYLKVVSAVTAIGIMLVVLTLCIIITTAQAFAGVREVSTIDMGKNAVTGVERGIEDSRTVNNYGLEFYATSSTRAYASVTAISSGVADSMTCTMVLQSATKGSNNYTTVSNSKVTRTVYDSGSMMLSTYYTISSTKDYRIKIQMTDEINGIRTTVTDYLDLTR